MHDRMLEQCQEVFKGIEFKLDTLIEHDDKINGRYEKHLDESKIYRENVVKHEQQLKDICSLKQWWQGAIITIFLGILSLAVIWGGLLVRVAHLERQNKIFISELQGNG